MCHLVADNILVPRHLGCCLVSLYSDVGMKSTQKILYFCIIALGSCCDPFIEERKEHPTLATAFLECSFRGRWEVVNCPSVSGRIGVYYKRLKKCTAFESTGHRLREKRQTATLPTASGSQRVGEQCNFNTDCVTGGYCESGLCRCWSTHVAIQSYCWRKVNPEQAGCSYDEQCNAVWPGAKCSNSICKCPNDRTPSPTREGPVCHAMGHCPTNGVHPLLYDRNTNTLSRCYFYDLPPSLPKADRFLGCDDFSDMYDCIDGFCCPTRAFACVQPQDEGREVPGFLGGFRWYFNAASQSCQSFNYSGAGGNANNFLTKEQCESYCMTRCARGQPQLDHTLSANNNLASLVVSCSTQTKGLVQSTCDENSYECSRIESLAMCCPRPSYICSNFGGISPLSDGTTPPPYSIGSNRLGQKEIVRWFWDTTTKTCQTFRYLGQGGNFNNFLSEQDCIEYCSKSLCPHGVPLQENSGSNSLACASSKDCPTSHFCTSTVCCPTADTVCNQPLALGAFCDASPMTRYWFNAAQATCEAFEYHGCQGNANNFASIFDCQNFCANIKGEPHCPQGKALRTRSGAHYQCSLSSTSGKPTELCPTNFECIYDGSLYGCCPTKAHTCQQNFNIGTMCNPSSSIRWYFKAAEQSCKTFQYYGCDGNSNNFATQRDCEDYCGISGCPDGGQVLKDASGKAIRCTSNAALCPATHECTTLAITFSIDSYCCPSRASICSQPIERGSNCGHDVQRYAFRQESKTCESFHFRGCGGNENNFGSKEVCLNFCHSSACLRGEVAYRHPKTGELSQCDFADINQTCPQGYRCVFDPLTNLRLCCGSPIKGFCPSNQFVYLDSRTYQVRQCQPNVVGSCPSGWSCLFNAAFQQYFCCGQPHEAICPLDDILFQNITMSSPVSCSMNLTDTCPPGYSCQSNSPLAMTGICCKSKLTDYEACPMGYSELPSRKVEEEVSCSPFIPSSCPDRYFCIFSEKRSRFACCKESDHADPIGTCPSNSTALLLPTTRLPKKCTFENESTCPKPYTCTKGSNNKAFCCSPAKLDDTGALQRLTFTLRKYICPMEMTPMLDDDESNPVACRFDSESEGESACPFGYECKFSVLLKSYICCMPRHSSDFTNSAAFDDRTEGTVSVRRLNRLTEATLLESAKLCAKGSILSSNGDRCLKIMLPLEYGCLESIQCPKNSYCSHRYCICRNGFVLFDTTCYHHCPFRWIEFHGRCIRYQQNEQRVRWRYPT